VHEARFAERISDRQTLERAGGGPSSTLLAKVWSEEPFVARIHDLLLGGETAVDLRRVEILELRKRPATCRAREPLVRGGKEGARLFARSFRSTYQVEHS
jgi:hypothetical protein